MPGRYIASGDEVTRNLRTIIRPLQRIRNIRSLRLHEVPVPIQEIIRYSSNNWWNEISIISVRNAISICVEEGIKYIYKKIYGS